MEEKEAPIRLRREESELGGEMEPCAVMSKPTTDRRVIEDCQAGDRDAFRQLFETHKDRVYSIALHFSRDEMQARDITQQVFLKLFTAIRQFRHDAEFTTWLYRLVANVCLDEQRRNRRFIPFGEAVEVSEMAERKSQEAQLGQREVSEAVRQVIAGLKPKLRLVILLKYFEEMSYEEMAQVLGCSPGTIASRLNRGHKILAQRLAHLRSQFVLEE
jgi:RNA polymerase sigma-70 factor (ECF subfamily)